MLTVGTYTRIFIANNKGKVITAHNKKPGAYCVAFNINKGTGYIACSFVLVKQKLGH